MFIISKLFGAIFLPPGIFIILLLISLFFLITDRKKLSIIILIYDILFLYFFSITPVKSLLLKPLENEYSFPDLSKLITCDAIVILGGGTTGRTPDLEMENALSGQSFLRTYTGYKIWKIQKKPIIASGGRILGAIEPEADTIARYLITLGVDEKDIIRESRSRNTIENGIYTNEILMKRNYKDIVLVTSAYHMKRSMEIFSKYNIKITPVPCDYSSKNKIGFYDLFVPQVQNITYAFIALHEYFGLLQLKLNSAVDKQ